MLSKAVVQGSGLAPEPVPLLLCNPELHECLNMNQ